VESNQRKSVDNPTLAVAFWPKITLLKNIVWEGTVYWFKE
jgi:hypothetical protein